jgi:putative peptidoglycan lipid II flippase
LLFFLAEPIIRLLFQYKAFSSYSTQSVSIVLMYLAPGLVAFSLVNIFARAFFALGDVKTPMVISVTCLAINLILAVLFLFVLQMGAAGLGLANTASSTLNLFLLIYALKRKLKYLDFAESKGHIASVIVCGLIAGFSAWSLGLLWTNHLGHGSVLMRAGEVFVPMIVATVVYFAAATWLKIPAANELLSVVKGRLRR